MTAVTFDGGPARDSADRNIFLVFIGLVWVGILSGFGTDSFDHVSKHGLDYPLIVHFHAVAFVGWLVLFTTQAALIRNGRPDLHRRLGQFGAGLAAVMAVLGPATALVADAGRYAATGETPEFLAVQLTDIVAFASLVGAGLLSRDNAPVHKRLLLMALFYISDAGFARFLNPMATAGLHGFWGEMLHLYLGSVLLMLALGAYDLIRHKRLYPAYVAALAWALVLQVTARTLLHDETWKALTLKMIGH